MSPDPQDPLPPQRRPRVKGGRNAGRHVIRTTQEEEDELQAKAKIAGTTVARYLVDAGRNTVPQVKESLAISELQGIRRQLQGEATNLNQLALQANIGIRWDDEIGRTLAEINSTNHKINGWLSR